MVSIPSGRTRLLVLLSPIVAVAVALAVVATVVVVRRVHQDEQRAAPGVRKAVVVDDLCAVVEPLVPQELGLGAGEPVARAGAGVERASCTFGSPGRTVLEVRVTSYDLSEHDPSGALDPLVVTACDAVAQQFPVGFAASPGGEEQGCSAQDADDTSGPVLVTATQVGRVDSRNAVVAVTLTDRRLPAQVAAYVSAITYGVAARDLTR